MADTYWDHPARRETRRLLRLGDVGAILDELQNQTTEWDDAREALDHLVRGPRAEVERLRKALHNGRAELCAVQIDRNQWRDRAHRLKVERDEALAALAQITAAAQRAALSDDPAPILYTALQAVKRDDAQRRLESDLRELVVLRRDVGAVQAERDDARAEVERLRAARGQAEADRDRLAEQVQRVRDRHPRKTDDADCMDADTTLGCQHGPGYHVVEYCGTCDEEWPCAEIRALGGTEAGR